MLLLNRFGLLICFAMIFLIVTACSSESMEDAMREVTSTDLSNENIDDIEVGMFITDETFLMKHRNVEPDPGNDHYSLQGRKYDQYWNKQVLLGVDRETKEILSVGILEDNHTSSSAKGIKYDAPLDNVISAYGENYFTHEDRDQGISVMGYVDHQNNLILSFTHFEGKVKGIRLGYPFDRMNWK